MNEEVLFIPQDSVVQGSCILSRKIAAIRLDRKTGGSCEEAKLGTILQLPSGSNLEVCGHGFNARIVKVRHGNLCYFVFKED